MGIVTFTTLPGYLLPKSNFNHDYGIPAYGILPEERLVWGNNSIVLLGEAAHCGNKKASFRTFTVVI